mmetsp:Transcript_35736/g.77223  ORF Transcript_35736/g.77223 Transcript_35736/m.77223 type:complete len:384 (+) Transcript_35736:269-1420(+)
MAKMSHCPAVFAIDCWRSAAVVTAAKTGSRGRASPAESQTKQQICNANEANFSCPITASLLSGRKSVAHKPHNARFGSSFPAESSLVEHLGDGAPADGEEGTLQAVGHDARLQASAEEAGIALLLDDQLRRLRIADGLQGGLPGGLQHSQGVGASVGDSSAGEADDSVSDILAIGEIELRQGLSELVVGVEPRVVAHPSSRHGSQGTLPQSRGVLLRLLHQLLQAVSTLDLLRGLPGVDGHQEDPEAGSSRRSAHGLGSSGELGVLQSSQGTIVRCSVSESGHGSLNQARSETSVESRNATLSIQLRGHLGNGTAIAVLVVHDGSHPHQGEDVDGLGTHAGNASAQGLLGGLGHDLAEGGSGLGRSSLRGVRHFWKKFGAGIG